MLFAAVNISCNKLDVKPRQSLVVPTTLQDFQGLMDNTDKLNTLLPVWGEISAGEFTVTDANYNSFTSAVKGCYIWDNQMFAGTTTDIDWDYSYQRVFYCNVVIDGLKNLQNFADRIVDYNSVKGQALFHRSLSFFNLLQEFAPPFKTTAATDQGIPLRLSSDLNVQSRRNTVEENYNQIISDLIIAKTLLPNSTTYKTRPSKAAAYGLLARVYLAKQDYTKALINADSCLKLYDKLIDYNSLSLTATFPFSRLNEEVIFQSNMANIVTQSMVLVSPQLYSLYESSDLRQLLYFRSNGLGNYLFKGSYYGSSIWFSGIATDEIFLIRAECYARLGKTTESMADLNTLLSKRYRKGLFNSITSLPSEEVLKRVVVERRKELLFRGIRWGDLKRFNLEVQFASTLSRTVGERTFTLLPNDSRYAIPIPEYIISATKIPQNP